MSILAEPKTKTRWGLNPRGKLWADDESKFGKKLMEKMGWQKGKGLGKNETGMTKNIVVFSKDDKKGVGWDDKTNNWIAHQDEFNSLLADLNKDYGNDETSGADAGQTQTSVGEEPVSLEVRSKSFKSRVHYKKFVRGKDVSQYSTEDIGCIFGKKVVMEARDDNVQKKNETENTTTVGSDGQIKTVTSVLSVTDYFAQKMKNKKLGSKSQTNTKDSSNEVLDDSSQPTIEKAESSVCDTIKKTTKAKKRKIGQMQTSNEIEENNYDEYGRVKRCHFRNNGNKQTSSFTDDRIQHGGNNGFLFNQADDDDDLLRGKTLKDTQINTKNSTTPTEKHSKDKKKKFLQKISNFNELDQKDESQNVDNCCAEPCLNECSTENVPFVTNSGFKSVNSAALVIESNDDTAESSSTKRKASPNEELEVAITDDDSSLKPYSCTVQESVNSKKKEGDVLDNNKKAKVSKVHSSNNSDKLSLERYQNVSQKQMKDKQDCIVGKNTESWGFTMKRTLQLAQYKEILMKFEAHSVFSTTNLTSLKGYGN